MGYSHYESFLQKLKEKGHRRGYTYAVGYMTRNKYRDRTLEGMLAVKVDNNTYAWVRDGDLKDGVLTKDQRPDVWVRFVRTDIGRLTPDGLYVVESGSRSQVTFSRHNVMTCGGRFYGADSESVVLFHDWVGTCFPFEEGVATGWSWDEDLRPGLEQLFVGFRCGDVWAGRQIAARLKVMAARYPLREQIFLGMAGKVLGQVSYGKGPEARRFFWKGCGYYRDYWKKRNAKVEHDDYSCVSCGTRGNYRDLWPACPHGVVEYTCSECGTDHDDAHEAGCPLSQENRAGNMPEARQAAGF